MAKKKKKKAASRGKSKAKAGRGTAKRGSAKRGSARETVVVTSKMKAYLRSNGFKAAGDLVEAVNNRVHEILDGAMSRTSGNKRATVRPHDV